MTSNSTILAIDRYISNLVKSKMIDPRVGRLATEISRQSTYADGKPSNGLAAAYIYFAAILLGINVPLSIIAGVSEFKIRKRCKDLLTSFKITINVKPLMRRPTVVKYLRYIRFILTLSIDRFRVCRF